MIKIPDTPSNAPLPRECEHLTPIVKLLELNGNKADYTTGVLTDKGCGSFLLFNKPIDLTLIYENVDVPTFIRLSDKGHIFCQKCWFTLEQKQKDKIYAGPRQIKW